MIKSRYMYMIIAGLTITNFYSTRASAAVADGVCARANEREGERCMVCGQLSSNSEGCGWLECTEPYTYYSYGAEFDGFLCVENGGWMSLEEQEACESRSTSWKAQTFDSSRQSRTRCDYVNVSDYYDWECECVTEYRCANGYYGKAGEYGCSECPDPKLDYPNSTGGTAFAVSPLGENRLITSCEAVYRSLQDSDITGMFMLSGSCSYTG